MAPDSAHLKFQLLTRIFVEGKCGCFLVGGHHYRGMRTLDAFPVLDGTQQILQAGGVVGADLDDMAALTGYGVTFQYFRGLRRVPNEILIVIG